MPSLSSRLLPFALLFGLSSSARADIAGPLPVSARVAQSQAVVVGKVTKIEPRTVKAKSLYGDDQVEYRVAVVKVDEALFGAKGLTHVKVGFLPPSADLIRRGRPRTDLRDGEEVLLYLSAHPTEAFHIAPQYFDVTYKSWPTYEKELKDARRAGKLLTDAKSGLQSKDAAERFLTAALLIQHYRAPRHYSRTPPKTEAIGAEESKRILEVLAEADWSRNEPHLYAEPNPAQAFARLGLTPADGWEAPKNFQDMPTAAKKWLKENADRYRIKRLLVESGLR